MQLAAELFAHRALIWRRTRADLRYRYSATAFGWLWTVFHPLALIATYSLIFGVFFSREMKEIDTPFAIFLCAGLLPWLSLTGCITQASLAFKKNRAFLKKLPVHESVYVGQVALTATIEMCISLGLLIIVALACGVVPTWTWLLLPVPLTALMVLGFGVGLAIGTCNVFVPDIGEVLPLALRVSMWLVPVVFPFYFYEDIGIGWLVSLFPPTPAIYSARELLIMGNVPALGEWIGMVAWAAAAFAMGQAVLNRLRGELRDVL